jgi:hypothetical protein
VVREHTSLSNPSLTRPAHGWRRCRIRNEDMVEPGTTALVAGESRVREIEVAGEDASLVRSGPRIDERMRPHELPGDDVRPGVRRVEIGDDADPVDANSVHDPPLPPLLTDLHSTERGCRQRAIDQDRVRLSCEA